MAVNTPYTFINDFSTTLASGYSPSDGVLHLTSATGANGLSLPTTGYYILKCEDEYFLATSRSGADITVTAPWGSSTDVAHSSGKVVTGCWVLPDLLDDLRYGGRDLLSGPKPYGTKGMEKHEYQTVSSGASFDILATVTGSGYVDSLWFADGSMADGVWQISVTIDGEGTPSINLIALENFCGGLKNGASFWAPMFTRDPTDVASFLPIPFSTSIKITVKNISGGTHTMFSQVTYNTGVTNNFPYGQKLFCVPGSSTNVSPNGVVTFINTSPSKRGRLAGIHWAVDTTNASDHTHPLEGNFKIYLDGASSPNLESSGAEDWFLMSNYFVAESVPTLIGESTALLQKGALTPFIWSAFRFHIKDPITFQSALKVTWNNGDTSEAGFTGTCDVFWTVWYYLET